VLTATGTANINGEANLTFDGSRLFADTTNGEIIVSPTGWRVAERAAIKVRSKINAPAELDLRRTESGREPGWHFSARGSGEGGALQLYKFDQSDSGVADTSSFVLRYVFNPNGSLGATGDMRAPIFYDSNNTAFYLDPSSTGISSSNAGGAIFRNIQISNASLTDTIQNVNAGGNIWLNYGHNGPVGLGFGGGLTTAYSGLAVNGTSSATGDMRAPIFYDSNDTNYYLDPASTGLALRVNGNIEAFARSASWAEGVRVRVPTTSTWGGFRLTRDRGNFDGNWGWGYVALDSTDDLVFGANNGGSQVDNILRMTKAGVVKIGRAHV
jgi:hypothetical protein